MSLPLVSCIIPCYNRADLVCYAIDSVLNQSYSAIETIVVDDGSTDNTPDVLAEYSNKVRVIRQQNGGTSAARNKGIETATGEYIAWLDSDDAWLPPKIEAQVNYLESHPDVAVVYTRCSPMDSLNQPPPPVLPNPLPEPQIQHKILYDFIIESSVMPSSCLVRRSAFDSVGGYDRQFFIEDWELDFRLARRYQFAYLDAPLTRYRIHNERKTNEGEPHALGRLKLLEKIKSLQSELVANDPSPEMLRAFQRHQKKYADSHYRLGKIYQDKGDYKKAAEAFDNAIKLDPTTFKYYSRRLQLALTSISKSR